MRLSGRTDLAAERHRADPRAKGVELCETRHGDMTVTRLTIDKKVEKGASAEPSGHYSTVAFPDLLELGSKGEQALCSLLAEEMAAITLPLLGAMPRDGRRVLAVGLGNRALTADAIGPMTLDRIGATGQLERIDPKCLFDLGCASLFCTTPGVLADSGIEAADAVRLLSTKLCPALIIVIDALAARDPERLCSTVQLSDVGIAPGSGIGNNRPGITPEILGVPVLSVGVPTVIDAAMLGKESEPSLFVTVKDIDARLARLAPILAGAIAKLLALPSELIMG